MRLYERAVLVMEDGSCWSGWSYGARGIVSGEVVFHTAMTGYQEALTDPSSRNLILVMTYPHVGNYGVNGEDVESGALHVKGLVVQDACEQPSNWRATAGLGSYLEEHGVVAVAGIDTRALARHLRQTGPLCGVAATGEVDVSALADKARRAALMPEQDLVSQVTTDKLYVFADGPGPRVTVVDCGATKSFMTSLAQRGCRVTVVPARAGVEEILATEPDGIVLSNGPGDPSAPKYLVRTAGELARLDGPVLWGIGLGHLLIAKAFGAEIYRVSHGHRGGRQPVKDVATGRVYMTARNQGFAVADDSWDDPDLIVTHRNLNDGTVAGLAHRSRPISSLEFQPEAPAGLKDAAHLVDRFVARLEGH